MVSSCNDNKISFFFLSKREKSIDFLRQKGKFKAYTGFGGEFGPIPNGEKKVIFPNVKK